MNTAQRNPATRGTLLLKYDRKYLPDFVALNRQWIEKHFEVEATDLKQLESPEELILNPGGEILFLLENEKVVGTVALIPHGEACFEIAKMAVAPESRGKGYGDTLMESAIEWGKSHGARKLTLLSNTVLEPAIMLYQKHGFQTTSLGEHPDYRRCNIEMELTLEDRK